MRFSPASAATCESSRVHRGPQFERRCSSGMAAMPRGPIRMGSKPGPERRAEPAAAKKVREPAGWFARAGRVLELDRTPLTGIRSTQKYPTSIRMVRSFSAWGRDGAGAGFEFCGLKGSLDVQLARASVVVHAVGDIAVLLGF